jgi:hypothetical protein
MKQILRSKHFYVGLLIVLAIIAGLNVVFFYISPQDIVDSIGVENTYLTIFAIAAIGGLSSFTSAALYSAIATFAAGGAIPWLLGLIGGVGIAIGDMIVFSLLKYGFTSVDLEKNYYIEKAQSYVDTTPTWLHYIVFYLILGFTPIPNDIVLAGLVVLGFTLRTLAPILVLSGITVATITAYAGQSIIDYFF